jgi:hypothetical protein
MSTNGTLALSLLVHWLFHWKLLYDFNRFMWALLVMAHHYCMSYGFGSWVQWIPRYGYAI